VNGELVSTMRYDSASAAVLGAAHLGAGTDVNSFYRGLIDEFAVYTNALSEERILAHYATVAGAIISPQPQDAAIFSGNTVSFNAGLITGFAEAPEFQWQRNGVDISGATAASYTTPALADSDSGARYRAVIQANGKTYITREATVSVTSLPPTGYRDAVLADAPFVYYRFEETNDALGAIDSSSNNQLGEYDGVILGQASYSAVLGKAARFDDSSIALPPLGNPEQISIEAWIKPDFFDEFNAIYTTDEWMEGSLHFQLVDDDSVRLSLNAGEEDEDADFGGSAVFAPGEWRHVVLTYNSDNSTAVLYVNGVAAGTNVFSIPPVIPDLIVSHIGSWNGDERFYYGLMDEFAMYNKVLSPERILAHYQAVAGTQVERPSIAFSRDGGQLTLSWTGAGLVLEQNSDPAANNWQAVPGVTGNSASVSMTGARNFFRLRRP
jgi:hypothetical protein